MIRGESPGAWLATGRAGAGCWFPAAAAPAAGVPAGRNGGCVSFFLGGDVAPTW